MEDPEATFIRALIAEMDEALEQHEGAIPPLLVMMWSQDLRGALPRRPRGEHGTRATLTIPILF